MMGIAIFILAVVTLTVLVLIVIAVAELNKLDRRVRYIRRSTNDQLDALDRKLCRLERNITREGER